MVYHRQCLPDFLMESSLVVALSATSSFALPRSPVLNTGKYLLSVHGSSSLTACGILQVVSIELCLPHSLLSSSKPPADCKQPPLCFTPWSHCPVYDHDSSSLLSPHRCVVLVQMHPTLMSTSSSLLLCQNYRVCGCLHIHHHPFIFIASITILTHVPDSTTFHMVQDDMEIAFWVLLWTALILLSHPCL